MRPSLSTAFSPSAPCPEPQGPPAVPPASSLFHLRISSWLDVRGPLDAPRATVQIPGPGPHPEGSNSWCDGLGGGAGALWFLESSPGGSPGSHGSETPICSASPVTRPLGKLRLSQGKRLAKSHIESQGQNWEARAPDLLRARLRDTALPFTVLTIQWRKLKLREGKDLT